MPVASLFHSGERILSCTAAKCTPVEKPQSTGPSRLCRRHHAALQHLRPSAARTLGRNWRQTRASWRWKSDAAARTCCVPQAPLPLASLPTLSGKALSFGRQACSLAPVSGRLRPASASSGLGTWPDPVDHRAQDHGQFRECRQAAHRRDRGPARARRRFASLRSSGVLTFRKGAPPPGHRSSSKT